MALDGKFVRVPPFADGEWLNVASPLASHLLKGQVTLVDFWDYTCINCLRTLPYLVEWYKRYTELGFTIIGVHTPEFYFAQTRQNVATAVADFNLPYPILLDNEYKTWHQFANRAWPTQYLVDADGYIRLKRQGEGHYHEVEAGIQELLRDLNPKVDLPNLMPPLRAEDSVGAVCYPSTPELHAGYRSGLFGSAVAHEPVQVMGDSGFYQLPLERSEDGIYLDGKWQMLPESAQFDGKGVGRVVVPYTAVSVNVVIDPLDDDVVIGVKQNGRWLTAENCGANIQFEAEKSVCVVKNPQMVELVQNLDYATNEVELIIEHQVCAIYAFSFTSCVDPNS